MKRAILRAIRFYQASVSPLFPPRCRYIPTCSCLLYTSDAADE